MPASLRPPAPGVPAHVTPLPRRATRRGARQRPHSRRARPRLDLRAEAL